jgi:nucleoside-diphosphate-sugar epimerase
MNVLLTGASSFTGFWFAKALAARGHRVYATFQGSPDSYDALRRRRIDALPPEVERLWEVSLQSESLLRVVSTGGRWDVLCLHGAYVTGYRNPDFDAVHALRNNTDGLLQLFERLAAQGLRRVVATGTVFEADEGAGEEPLRAFSPYGLSKTLTWKVQQYLAQSLKLSLGKFVIPNPFGPFETPRFTTYLLKNWYMGKTVEVRTPAYIRDNIHVSRLAEHYADFAEGMPSGLANPKCAPIGYVESQGAFTLRFAAEMRKRLGLACEVALVPQTDFSEPLMRVNTQVIQLAPSQWSEAAAWDELAAWYASELGSSGME